MNIFPITGPSQSGLPGIEWPVTRTPEWRTRTQEVVSGKEFRQSWWTWPRWHWKLSYSVLSDARIYLNNLYTDLKTLEGFFLQQNGAFSPFLFFDPSDNNATNQAIGTGNGSTVSFQLVRSFGGFTEPMQSPITPLSIYINSSLQSNSTYSVGSTGIVTFNTAPVNTAAITASFSFYFAARFEKDMTDFEEFVYQLWEAKEIDLISVKL